MNATDGTPFIQITRHPYEEPYHLDLEITASNGVQSGIAQFYINASALMEWGSELANFPKHSADKFLWTYGSEYPEDKWYAYFRFHVFMRDKLGHCAIHFRWNNNREIPQREIFEFCLPAEIGGLNRLGKIFLAFARL